MHVWKLLRKGAAILLVLCFFMPLSKCESKVGTDGKTATTTDIYIHPYQLADGIVLEVVGGKISEVLSLVAVLGIFFLPLISLPLSARWQTAIHIPISLAAQYWLYLMTYFYQGIQIGGALAMGCWALIFCCACAELWRRWRTGSWLATDGRVET